MVEGPCDELKAERQAHFKMSDGFSIFCRRWDAHTETRSVILGLHGIGGHSGNFALMGGQLSARVPAATVYAIDRRGFGNSVEEGFQRGGISNFDRYLRDIDESVERIREEQTGKNFYLFGKSLGCVHALRFAAGHPGFLRGLILAAPPVMTKAKIPRRLLLRAALLLAFSPGTLIDTVKYQPEGARDSEEVKAVSEDPLSSHGRFSVRYLVGVSRFMRTTLENAGRVQAPTLILQGGVENVVSPEGAPRLLTTLAASDKSLRTFPDANHGFYDSLPPRTRSEYDDAQRKPVYDTIVEWLKAH